MAKRLSDKEKEDMVRCFTLGKTIEELSIEFKCTKLTISRNLKKNLGINKYKALSELKNSYTNKGLESKNNISDSEKTSSNSKNTENNFVSQPFLDTQFIEITPLDYQIENLVQKDLSSIPIKDIEFPKIVYMIVDKNIELETKYLKDYPDWQFLSQEELNRKTIEIYMDLQKAKRMCTKEQKVIKVPNTDVFKIVAPLLISRGISRIVNDDNLIAL